MDDTTADDDRAHLEDVEDGCGCAEIMDHLSEQRAAVAADDD
jgi:hypothetical protein